MTLRHAVQTQTALKKGRARSKPPLARDANAAATSWMYFTVEGMIYSQGVDIFVPDVDMAQHAVPLDVAFPLRLKHAQDFWMVEASHDVTVVLPFEIRFRMLKTHAGEITDGEIKRDLQAEFDRLLPKAANLREEGVPIHTEILRKAKAVRITEVARSTQPDEDYASLFS
jgi:hypothetical protein